MTNQPASSKTLSTTVHRSYTQAYEFLSKPENFPKWASGLAQGLKRGDDEWWTADTQDGQVKVKFTGPNEFGVLDHTVMPKPGVQIHIPMRLIPNGDGCDLIFTLFRQPEMSDEKFEEDARWVQRDLAKLKEILEGRQSSAEV